MTKDKFDHAEEWDRIFEHDNQQFLEREADRDLDRVLGEEEEEQQQSEDDY